MTNLWEKFRGSKTEISLAALAIAGRLAQEFPAWTHWGLTQDILSILLLGAVASRVHTAIKNGRNGNGKPPEPPNAP